MSFEYEFRDGLTVEVWLDYQPENGDGWNEPRYPEMMLLDGVSALDGSEVSLTKEQERELDEWMSMNQCYLLSEYGPGRRDDSPPDEYVPEYYNHPWYEGER